MAANRLLRDRSGQQRVTNIELFFDLVYVFAVTQLSHYLLDHPTVRGALQAGLLLVMVWLVWAYTTWVTNWLDPEQIPVRLLLVALMLVSLAMSATLPRAFGDLGLWVGGAYAVQQIGRSVFMVVAVRGHPLQENYERILAWCVVSGALAVGGGFSGGYLRDVLWPRMGGIAVLALLGLAARSIPALALAACAAALVTAVAATDRLPWLPRPVLDAAGPAPGAPSVSPPAPDSRALS